MSLPALLFILLIMLVYLDFAIWYNAEMLRKERKFKGLLRRFWDWLMEVDR